MTHHFLDRPQPNGDPRPSALAIFGPTAIGKTQIAISIGEGLRKRGEDPVAISADALAVYKGLEILTAVPTIAEQARLEHRLISFVDLRDKFSVGQFMKLAHQEVDNALERGRRPIVVGGTGLYLRAAICDLDLKPSVSVQSRSRWETELTQRGASHLHELLAERDSELASRIPKGDSHRLIRAHELLDAGITPAINSPNSQLWTSEIRLPTVLIGLTMARDALNDRIEQRVDSMIAAGVVDEVRRADEYGASVTARKALGFRELLAGDIDAMKTASRQLARRQLTWMRKLAGIHTIDVTNKDAETVAREILRLLNQADHEI